MNDVQVLTQNVRRITAPNPGPMTGAGTNTYILGRDRFVVVDPGPAIDSHIEAILKQVDGRLEAILVTHTHSDHSPAAAKLAARTLAPRYGLVSSNIALQDATSLLMCYSSTTSYSSLVTVIFALFIRLGMLIIIFVLWLKVAWLKIMACCLLAITL